MSGGNSTTLSTQCDVNNSTDPLSGLSIASSVLTCGVGLPLNIYVVWLIISGAGSSIETDFFFLNLALTDIIFLTGYLMTPFITFCPGPVYKAIGYFFHFNVIGHPLFQMCICVEYYLAVLHPVLFQKYRPLRYRVAGSAVIWLVILASFVLSELDRHDYEIVWTTLSFALFPCMIFCCLAVLRALREPGPGDRMGERAGADQVKAKAFRIITVIMMTHFIVLLGYIVQFSVRSLENSQKQMIIDIVYIIVMNAFSVPPVLFLHRSGKLPGIATC